MTTPRITAAFLAIVGIGMAPSSTAAPPELSIGKPREVSPGVKKANQRWPAITASKNGYLVVWQEGDLVWNGEADLFAARLSADGQPLDAAPIALVTKKGHQAYPSVAFDGKTYVVVWSDFRTGRDWDVYAARVSLDGKVLDPDGVRVAAGPGNQAYAVVASDRVGTSMVVWSDVRPRPDQPKLEVYALFGTLFKGGEPLHTDGRELGRAPGSLLTPAIVWDGANYQVLSSRGGDGWDPISYAISVSPEGKAQPSRIAASGTYSLAADPETKRTLVWSNRRYGHGAYVTRYLGSLYSPDAKSAVVSEVLGLQRAWAPTNDQWGAAVFNGKNFVGVVEQCEHVDIASAGIFKSLPAGVRLAATRLDAATARAIDAGWFDRDTKNPDKGPSEADFKSAAKPPFAATETGIKLRHPALASCGGGKAVLVYSRHGGVDNFKIHAVLLKE